MRASTFAVLCALTCAEGAAADIAMPLVSLFDDVTARAAAVCPAPSYACDPDALARFNGTIHISIDAPPGVAAKAALKTRDGPAGCPIALAVRLEAATAELVADWSRAAFVVEGVASPAVAGRLRNTGNRERVGTAPIGAALVEDIYLVDGACLLPVGDPRPVQLSVPLDVGGRRANLVVTCRIEPVPSTAREVLSLIAEPPSAGRAPPPAPAGEALIPGAVTGAGIGLAVAITTGVVVGTSVGGLLGKDLPANGRAPVVLAAASAGLYTALLSGLFALPLGVVVGGGIGYGIDEQNRPVVEAARRHRALQAAHDAWEAARKEAGLDVDTATDGAPSTRPSDPPLDAPLDPQGEPQGDPSSSHPRS